MPFDDEARILLESGVRGRFEICATRSVGKQRNALLRQDRCTFETEASMTKAQAEPVLGRLNQPFNLARDEMLPLTNLHPPPSPPFSPFWRAYYFVKSLARCMLGSPHE